MAAPARYSCGRHFPGADHFFQTHPISKNLLAIYGLDGAIGPHFPLTDFLFTFSRPIMKNFSPYLLIYIYIYIYIYRSNTRSPTSICAQAQSLPKPLSLLNLGSCSTPPAVKVIDSDNPDLRIRPASLTKIMTAYLVFNALKEKRLDLAQQVTVSTRAWKVDASSSKMFIDPATPVSISDLLYGLIVPIG